VSDKFSFRNGKTESSKYSQDEQGGLIILWFYKGKTSYGIEKMYLLYIFPLELHTHFVVLISLTHSRKLPLVVVQIRKAKNLSAPIRM
jgi:hypothetical protein